MPVFEAVNNGLYASQNTKRKEVIVKVHRDSSSFINSIKIIDYGVGLDKHNLEAFRTPYTGNRIKSGGKGIGRFMGHAIFDKITYQSIYADLTTHKEISFQFTLKKGQEFTDYVCEDTNETQTGTTVIYSNVKRQYAPFTNTKSKNIQEELCLHFLSQLASGQCNIIIEDGSDEPVHLNKYFQFLSGDEFKLPYDLKGKLSKYYTVDKILSKNSIFLVANDRVVECRDDLNNVLGVKKFQDENGDKYVYDVVIYGDFLDKRVNQVRTGFDDFSEEKKRDITSRVANKIKELEKEAYKAVKKKQQKFYENIININPSLQSVDFDVDKIPPSMTSEQIAQDLLIRKYRDEEKAYKKFSFLLKEKDVPDEEFDELVESFSQQAQAELAHYIAYRDRIIQGLKRLSETQDPNESKLHNLISPYGKNKKQTTMTPESSYAENNFWLLDDRFMSFSKAFSDERIKKIIKEVKNNEDVTNMPNYEPDIVIFYNDIGESNYKDIVLVEFKACGTDERKKVSSISQINTDLSYIISSKELEKINNFWGYIVTDFDERTIRTLRAQQGLQELISMGEDPIFYYYNSNFKRNDGTPAHAHIYILHH